MATITYTYVPNQIVWAIVPCGDDESPIVKEGTVKQVRMNVLVTGETIEYDVQLGVDRGTTPIAQIDIFVDLAAATTEYAIRLAA